jgi:hypothetical protein
MKTWRDCFNSVTVEKASFRDYLIFDEEARRTNEAGLRKPLEEHDSWLELAPPAFSVERTRPWSPRLAIKKMGVKVVEFDDENHGKWTKGYAAGDKLAIRPNHANPLRTLFHELGHIALRHTYIPDPLGRDMEDPIREVQAEATSYLCMTYAGAATAALHATVKVYNRKHIAAAGRWPTKEERDQSFEAAEIIIGAGRPDGRPVILPH